MSLYTLPSGLLALAATDDEDDAPATVGVGKSINTSALVLKNRPSLPRMAVGMSARFC